VSDDPRVERLLDELFDSDAAPEEVCGSCPELLPAVRERLRLMCRVEAVVDALFPSLPGPGTGGPLAAGDAPAPPAVPGYEIEAVLGRGGMGVVYKARHLALKRTVALKTLAAGHSHPADRARFRAEAEAVARLQHPNIVQIYEIGEAGGQPFFALEFVAGGSLDGRLAGRPLPPPDAARLVAALADGMHLAHSRNLVHRDLKPANVLLAGELDAPISRCQPKVTDFGLVRQLDADSGQTWAGAVIGTPAYMAPEQAQGRAHAAGPSADLYALGAILYECLTGRPPFRGATPLETLEQVRTREPAAPSSLNRQVPRDLETICLKCLRKEPERRYASARELADDLHRFLDGQPVRARPVGAAERAVKWARRRPAAALLVAALLVLFSAAAGAGLWLRQQEADRQAAKTQRQGQAREAIETALGRANDLRGAEKWPEGLQVLAEASTRLAEADSPSLEKRLKQAQLDFTIAADLQRVRENSPLRPTGEIDYRQWAAEFREAFERAELRIGEDAQPVVDSIRASAIRDQLVAALEHRAYVAYSYSDYPLADWLLEIARSADPEPRWRDRFRQLSTWRATDKLLQIAGDAFNTSPPPTAHDLALLGCLLRRPGASRQGIEMLREACRRQPSDFWLNREMGASLSPGATLPLGNQHSESAAYYRAALAVRPDHAGVHQELGQVLFSLGQIDDALAEYRRAVQLSPTSRSGRHYLVGRLATAGRWVEADDECRKALDVDPKGYYPPYVLGAALSANQRDEDAIVMLRTAINADPDAVDAYYYLAMCLVRLAQHDEAVTVLRKVTDLTPRNCNARSLLARELAAVGRPKEAFAELQTGIALVPEEPGFSVALGELLRTQGRFEEAVSAFRTAANLLPESTAAWDGLAASLLDAGRFAEARAATKRLLDLPATDATREARRQLDLCDALQSVAADLPAMLTGKKRPAKASTQLALAEWCLRHKRLTATAADLYGAALTAEPDRADDLEVGNRFHAASAAALAGCGLGDDATKLDDRRRAVLRQQALDWLTVEYKAWARRHRRGKPGDRTTAATAVRAWQQNKDLAGIRAEQALARFPLEEQRAWQTFWADVAALAAGDPVALFDRARAHVARREWRQAAECYADGFELEPTDDGELWFEYAAVQLLAEDRAGYRRTCAHLLDRCQSQQMRPYLVARACTLGPDSADATDLPSRLSQDELQRSATAFWSLTEQGALHVRAGRFQKAIPLLGRSLAIDGRPGRAVLNWLWLAVAYGRLGQAEEARRWLARASGWLDQQAGRMPVETPDLGLHRHNWLEAHLLRQEVETLLR
jgi:serine/threonine-protein kinase